MTKVIFYPEREGRKGQRSFILPSNQRVVLQPGVNDVDASLILEFSNSTTVKELVKSEVIKILSKPSLTVEDSENDDDDDSDDE